MFNFFKTKPVESVEYLDLRKLSQAVILSSSKIDLKIWEFGSHSKDYKTEKILINDLIRIDLGSSWTTDKLNRVCGSVVYLHYIVLNYDIIVSGVKVWHVEVEKDLSDGNRLDDNNFEVNSDTIMIHKLNQEQIINLNEWSENAINVYSAYKNHDKELRELKALIKFEKEEKILNGE